MMTLLQGLFVAHSKALQSGTILPAFHEAMVQVHRAALALNESTLSLGPRAETLASLRGLIEGGISGPRDRRIAVDLLHSLELEVRGRVGQVLLDPSHSEHHTELREAVFVAPVAEDQIAIDPERLTEVSAAIAGANSIVDIERQLLRAGVVVDIHKGLQEKGVGYLKCLPEVVVKRLRWFGQRASRLVHFEVYRDLPVDLSESEVVLELDVGALMTFQQWEVHSGMETLNGALMVYEVFGKGVKDLRADDREGLLAVLRKSKLEVVGTERGGRVTKADVIAALEAKAEIPETSLSGFHPLLNPRLRERLMATAVDLAEAQAQLRAAHAELGAKTASLGESQTAVVRLETAMEEAHSTLEQGREERDRLRRDLEARERELAETRSDVVTKARDLERAEADLAAARTRMDALEAQVTALSDRPETTEYDRVVAALAEAEEAKGRLEERVAGLVRTEQDLSAEVDRVTGDLRRAQEAEASARAELVRANEAHEAAQQEVERLTVRVDELERRPTQEVLDQVRAELAVRVRELGDLQGALVANQQALAVARTEVVAAQGEVGWQTLAVDRLRELNQALRGQVDALLGTLGDAHRQIVSLGAERDEAEGAARRLGEVLQDLREVKETVVEPEEALIERPTSEAFDELEQRLLHEQDRVARLTEQLRTFANTADQRVASRTGELTQARETSETARAELKAKTTALEESQAAVAQLEAALEGAQGAFDGQGEEVDRLRTTLEAREGELARVRKAHEAAEEQLATARTTLAAKGRELEGAETRVEALQGQVTELEQRPTRGDLDNARRELETAQERLREVEGTLGEKEAAVVTKLAELARATEAHRAAMEQLAGHLRVAREGLADKTAELERTATDLASARARVDGLEAQVKALGDRPERVEYDRVVADLAEANEAKGRLEERVTALTRTEQDLGAEVDRIAGDLRNTQEAEASARAELVRVSEARGVASQEVERLTARLAELGQRPTQEALETARAELREKTTALGESQAAHAAELMAQKLLVAQAVIARDQFKAHLENVTADRDRLSGQVEALQGELEEARLFLERMRQRATREVPIVALELPDKGKESATTAAEAAPKPVRRPTPLPAVVPDVLELALSDPRVGLEEVLRPLLFVRSLTGSGDQARLTLSLREGVHGAMRLNGGPEVNALELPAVRGAHFELVTPDQTFHVMVRIPQGQEGALPRLETYQPNGGTAADPTPAGTEYTVAHGPFEAYFSVTNPTPARDGNGPVEGSTLATIHGGNHNPGVWAGIVWKGRGVGKVAGQERESNSHVRLRQGTAVETPTGLLFLTFFNERMRALNFLSTEDVVYGDRLDHARRAAKKLAMPSSPAFPARFSQLVDTDYLALSRVGDDWQLTYLLRNGVQLELPPGKRAEANRSSITSVVLSHGNPLTFHHGGQTYPYTFKVLDEGKLVVIDMSPLP